MRDAPGERRDRFERLFADHYEALLAYALRRATRDEAEDVVADAYLVVWRRLDEVPADARPWLFGVARRVLADQRRGERRRASLRARIAAQPCPAPVTTGSSDVLSALARIPERDRELLLLVAWDGLAPVQAARALGISRVAVRVRLHRARKRFATALDIRDSRQVSHVELQVEKAR